jgi:precorrin-3B synthase
VAAPARRHRRDRCPGALRPWPADDGLLVRLRLVGGRLSVDQLLALIAVAEQYGDGCVYLTGRANLQLRGLPGADGVLEPAVLDAIERTGLLPSRSHELVRNILVSPQTGLCGGRIDLRPIAAELDRRLLADPEVAGLSGRFLFGLDDGRGDLIDRGVDLGLVALDDRTIQLRVGAVWGDVIPAPRAATAITGLAREFSRRRGGGPTAAWHVAELDEPLCPSQRRDPRVPAAIGPLNFGAVAGGHHVAVPDGLDRAGADELASLAAPDADLVVTPWRGVLAPSRQDPQEER